MQMELFPINLFFNPWIKHQQLKVVLGKGKKNKQTKTTAQN